MSSCNAAIRIVLFIGLLITSSCAKTEINNPIEYILKTSDEAAIRQVMDHLSDHEVQVYFSQIERKNGNLQFSDYTFQVQDSLYFYPASTVKLPIAVLALEKLSEIENLDLHTNFYIEGDTIETTLAQEVIKVFAVSDNAASNRMFEFLGQDRINHGFQAGRCDGLKTVS